MGKDNTSSIRFGSVARIETGTKILFFRKTVHTVHCAFLFIKFIMLHGEGLVNSEHFTVHFGRFAGKKRPAMRV
ncbi:hypothetical protein, partial [Salmonella enterica]|uniref:hypothetical protein n=1 Tax=Salmonella enterica TaxID=28901 RepID=UPI003298E02E